MFYLQTTLQTINSKHTKIKGTYEGAMNINWYLTKDYEFDIYKYEIIICIPLCCVPKYIWICSFYQDVYLKKNKDYTKTMYKIEGCNKDFYIPEYKEINNYDTYPNYKEPLEPLDIDSDEAMWSIIALHNGIHTALIYPINNMPPFIKLSKIENL